MKNHLLLISLVCLSVAGLFAYGKYFVAGTPLEKVDYSLTAMLWVVLGLIIMTNLEIKKVEEKFEEWKSKN